MVNPTRKGATSVAGVSADVLDALEAGEIETASLSECLAIDLTRLLATVFPQLRDRLADAVDPKAGITKRMAAASGVILQEEGAPALSILTEHSSDMVRGVGAYIVGRLPDLSLSARLERMRPLADDRHFGVREWAWLALRSHVVRDPLDALALLQSWAVEPSANLRRFAVEATRPRGVWSSHIKLLKEDPSPGLPLLAAARSDPVRYVQDSVANWLNDAAKSRPDWVTEVCRSWLAGQPTEETKYIVKRALRSLPA